MTFFCSSSGSNSASNVWAGSSTPFLLWVFKRFLIGTQPLPLYVPSPVKNVTRESGRFREKVRVKPSPSGLPLANGLRPALGQKRQTSRSSAIKHLQLCKVFFRSWLGAQLGWPPLMCKTPKPPRCLELNDPYLS